MKHKFGPYAENLRHVLNRMEGHFIRGVGDGVADADIEAIPEALEEAEKFIESTDDEGLSDRVERVSLLIEGYQSPYGMELLATVHWAATRMGGKDFNQTLKIVQSWNKRKAELMPPVRVDKAWNHLVARGWLQD